MAEWEINSNSSHDKSLRRFDISRSRGGYGYYTASIRNPKSGSVETIGPYRTPELLERHIELYCRKHMYEAGETWGGKRRGAGRKKGTTKQVIQKRADYSKFLEKEFGKIKARAIMVADAAAAGACARITEKVASDVLRRVVNSQGRFNIYSGNLSNAYQAMIVQGRKVVQIVKRDKRTAGNKFHSHNGRLVVRLKTRRHATPNNRWKYRYVKPYEIEEGYEGMSSFRGNSVFQLGYMAGRTETNRKGRTEGRVQSGIIVENTAPYAGAVQARGYQVTPNAFYRSYQGRIGSAQKSVAYVMTKNMLKAAKLI